MNNLGRNIFIWVIIGIALMSLFNLFRTQHHLEVAAMWPILILLHLFRQAKSEM